MSEPSISAAVTVAVRLLRDRPGELLPAYLLASAVATVARVPVLLGAGGAVVLLATTGRVGPVVRAVGSAQQGDTPPTELSGVVEPLVSLDVIGVILLGALATLVVATVVRPIAVAVAQSTVWAAIDGADDPLARGVAGASRWKTFLGVFLLRTVAGLALVGVPALVAVTFGLTSPIVAVVAGLLALLGGGVYLLVSAALSFAGPAVVVDDAGVVGAVTGSVVFIRNNIGTAVGFLVIAAGGFVLAGVLAGVASALGAGRLGGLLVPFVVSPVFDLAATGLYAGVATDYPTPADQRTPAAGSPATPTDATTTGEDATGATDASASAPDETGAGDATGAADETGAAGDTPDTADSVADTADDVASTNAQTHTVLSDPPRPVVRPAPDRAGIRSRLRRALTDGLRAFAGVVPTHPAATAVATVSLVAGILAGWLLTAPYGVQLDPPAEAQAVFGAVPIDAFLNIAANNWLVAVGGTYGGIGFGVPTAMAAITNGVLIGALAGVFDPVAFVAFVAPHGVIELPTLIVAWALGIHLGVVGWRSVRGRTTPAAVAAELRAAGRVIVGVAVLLIVAAAIEAFITPTIAGLVA